MKTSKAGRQAPQPRGSRCSAAVAQHQHSPVLQHPTATAPLLAPAAPPPPPPPPAPRSWAHQKETARRRPSPQLGLVQVTCSSSVFWRHQWQVTPYLLSYTRPPCGTARQAVQAGGTSERGGGTREVRREGGVHRRGGRHPVAGSHWHPLCAHRTPPHTHHHAPTWMRTPSPESMGPCGTSASSPSTSLHHREQPKGGQQREQGVSAATQEAWRGRRTQQCMDASFRQSGAAGSTRGWLGRLGRLPGWLTACGARGWTGGLWG